MPLSRRGGLNAQLYSSQARVRDSDIGFHVRPGHWPVLSYRSGRSPNQPARAEAAGSMPVALVTASGNLAGWAVASVTMGTPHRSDGHAPHARRRQYADRADSRTARRSDCMAAAVAASSAVPAAKISRMSPRAASGMVKRPDWASEPISPVQLLGIAAQRLEQQTLEIGRDLDVHGGAGGRCHGAGLVDDRCRGRGAGCRWRWWRSPACRWAGPCAGRSSRRRCRRNCRWER